jgi:hypothetical protein
MYTKITPEDEEQLIGLVESLPNVDKRIVAITRYSTGEVRIMTGEVLAPLVGGGDSIGVERVDGVWRVKHVGSWFA